MKEQDNIRTRPLDLYVSHISVETFHFKISEMKLDEFGIVFVDFFSENLKRGPLH